MNAMDVDNSLPRPQIFLDISINNKIVGKVIFQLYNDHWPKLSEVFLALCSGFSNIDEPDSGKDQFYKGSKILAIEPGKYICIGFLSKVPLESIAIPEYDLTKTGYLAVIPNRSSDGLHQYIITISPLNQLTNDNCLVFGHILKGLGVIKQIQDLETNANGILLQECKISDCGIYDASSIENLHALGNGVRDTYPDWPEDELNTNGPSLFTDAQNIINLVTHVKYFGRLLFKRQNYEGALQKYIKALRYLNAFLEYSQRIPSNISQRHHEPIMKLILTCVLNSAACRIKMRKFEEALIDCDEALDLDPLNPRGYLRKGQSYHGLGMYNQAIEVLQKD